MFSVESCCDKSKPYIYALDASALSAVGRNADSLTTRSWRPSWSRISMRDGRVQGGTVGELLLLPLLIWDLLWTNCQWRSTHSVGVTSSQDEFHLNRVSIILTASCVRPTAHIDLTMRPDPYSTPGARFTKYLKICPKIIVRSIASLL